VTGLAPIVACAAYAALLWGIARALDAIGRRAARPRAAGAAAGRGPVEHAVAADVARFHRVIGGAVLAAGAFLLSALALARRDAPALLLVPLAGGCLAGAVRRLVLLWRD
jgi:hypothetical protein